MKRQMILVLVVMVFIFAGFTAIAEISISSSEVGRNYGCNLSPKIEGEETYYRIRGEGNDLVICCSIPLGQAVMTRLELTVNGVRESRQSRSISPIIGEGWQSAGIVLPPSMKRNDLYELRIFYIPVVKGLINIRVFKGSKNREYEIFASSVYLMVVPPSHTIWDVNWDGVVDDSDVRDVNYFIKHPEYRDDHEGGMAIAYYRCDIDGDNKVTALDRDAVENHLLPRLQAAPGRSKRMTTWGALKR